MPTFLITIIVIILGLAALAASTINSRRPKIFKGKLKPFEKSLFRILENQLEVNAGERIPRQLSYLKQGVRLYFPKSYTLELYDYKQNPLPDDILFERKDQFKLATLSFSVGDTKYKAEFNAYSGRIYGFTVRPNPKDIFIMSVAKFDSFKCINDPMQKLDLEVKVQYYPKEEKFGQILGELNKQYELSEVRKPLPKKQKELFVKLANTRFPVDFLELCDQTNGFKIDDVYVNGLGGMQDIALDDGNYLMIAEKAAGCLSIKRTKYKTQLMYHSYEDETDVRHLGDSFLAALSKFMKIGLALFIFVQTIFLLNSIRQKDPSFVCSTSIHTARART